MEEEEEEGGRVRLYCAPAQSETGSAPSAWSSRAEVKPIDEKKKLCIFFPDLLFFFCVLLIYPKDGISVSDFCNGEQRKQQQQRK